MAGLFIVLDGIDGCGKSTQAQLLVTALRGRGDEALLTFEPGDTPVGDKIRQILLDPDTGDIGALTEALLFCADRAEHVATVIRPALEAGKTVVSDRFGSSTAAYQGFAGELDFEVVRRLNDIATGGLVPDLLIVLDIDRESARERLSRIARGHDRIEQNVQLLLTGLGQDIHDTGWIDARLAHDHFSRVREGFRHCVEIAGNRGVVIDACQSVEAVHEEIMRSVENVRIP
jgi:dTMP kinase